MKDFLLVEYKAILSSERQTMRLNNLQIADFALYSSALLTLIPLLVNAQTEPGRTTDRDGNGIGVGTVTAGSVAEVTINGHTRVELPLPPDGKLTFHNLDWVEVGTASVRSVGAGGSNDDNDDEADDTHITCFFWHEDDGSAPDRRTRSVDMISAPFTTETELEQPFANARRVYCFDSSADMADDDDDTDDDGAFVIFVKNEQGQEGLVRVRMGDGVRETVNNDIRYEARRGMGPYGVFNMNVGSYRQLGYDVTRAAVVHEPTTLWREGVDRLQPESEDARSGPETVSRAACMVFSGSKPVSGLWMGNQLAVSPPRDVTRIACFTAETPQQASKNWLAMRKWDRESRVSSAQNTPDTFDWW